MHIYFSQCFLNNYLLDSPILCYFIFIYFGFRFSFYERPHKLHSFYNYRAI